MCLVIIKYSFFYFYKCLYYQYQLLISYFRLVTQPILVALLPLFVTFAKEYSPFGPLHYYAPTMLSILAYTKKIAWIHSYTLQLGLVIEERSISFCCINISKVKLMAYKTGCYIIAINLYIYLNMLHPLIGFNYPFKEEGWMVKLAIILLPN